MAAPPSRRCPARRERDKKWPLGGNRETWSGVPGCQPSLLQEKTQADGGVRVGSRRQWEDRGRGQPRERPPPQPKATPPITAGRDGLGSACLCLFVYGWVALCVCVSMCLCICMSGSFCVCFYVCLCVYQSFTNMFLMGWVGSRPLLPLISEEIQKYLP